MPSGTSAIVRVLADTSQALGPRRATATGCSGRTVTRRVCGKPRSYPAAHWGASPGVARPRSRSAPAGSDLRWGRAPRARGRRPQVERLRSRSTLHGEHRHQQREQVEADRAEHKREAEPGATGPTGGNERRARAGAPAAARARGAGAGTLRGALGHVAADAQRRTHCYCSDGSSSGPRNSTSCTELVQRLPARLGHQHDGIFGAGTVSILDEVRVARRDLRATDPMSLQAAGLKSIRPRALNECSGFLNTLPNVRLVGRLRGLS